MAVSVEQTYEVIHAWKVVKEIEREREKERERGKDL